MTNAFGYGLAGAAALLLAGCATTSEPQFKGLPPVSVHATGETVPVGTNNADAADDPAIWRNAANPAASLIVATDKKAGLYVYGLDGKVKSFLNAGRVNNVDLVEKGGTVYAVASDRNDPRNAKLRLRCIAHVWGDQSDTGSDRTPACSHTCKRALSQCASGSRVVLAIAPISPSSPIRSSGRRNARRFISPRKAPCNP